MPTPNLYAHSDVDPVSAVDPLLQTNEVDVLYLTDRAMEGGTPEAPKYGAGRSRSIGYGISRVALGHRVSWPALVEASRTQKRSIELPLSLISTHELGRFPPTPHSLAPPGKQVHPAVEAERKTAEEFTRLLSERLSQTRVKEVYLFVHGYNNDFAVAVETIAQLWHFFGREGVPIAYTWPAGSWGVLRGYTYDRESGEFTVYHLKQMIRLIAQCPDVQKVHILAHSRGTDVAVSALRELHLQFGGSEDDATPGAVFERTRAALKLGTLVLAAPDMDIDVVIQRIMTVRLGLVPERFALYVCAKDQALGASNWLFRGKGRLGTLNTKIFSPEELTTLRASKTVQVIDARVSDPGPYGHSYFYSNPAVSSDVILLMRYQLSPGAESGRPLGADPKGFWFIDDNYPGAATGPPQSRHN
jgi:esterase/lipase superfamily enzyme